MRGSVTATERDRYTVAGLLRHFARVQPDHEMLVLGSDRRTWREEYDIACTVAQAARRDGLGVGDRIAFLDRNGIAYFDFLFGGSLIGAVNVAVNWRLSPVEMAAIIDDAAAPVLAIHSDYLGALAEMPSAAALGANASSSSAMPPRRAQIGARWLSKSGSRVAQRRTRATSAVPLRSACSSTPRAPPGCPRA